MKAIMVMFDSLNRHLLAPYGAEWTDTPNFARLARRAVTFDKCYAGSLPCIPARRELHTGRHNFLHRSWGPLEPFDDSMPELLKASGVYSHLASDHQHYWEDGGGTYHTRYSTWEFFRGQEGDPWKGHVGDPEVPEHLGRREGRLPTIRRQDWVNREYMRTEADHPQVRTFDAGLEFIETNRHQDNWFLQIETFDPHEPFFTHKQYKDLYPHEYEGPHFDWPKYGPVTETSAQAAHLRFEYAALLSMCDQSLGRVLDVMDRLSMWDDTMLIVCTDHGYLLGENGWWGKSVSPWYDQLVHLPLFVWDPRAGVQGQRRSSLVQTIDIAPTILEFFGTEPTADMQGSPLANIIADDTPVREAGLFGSFGNHVNVTDGRYVYMRAPDEPVGEQSLYEYTLMPTHMRSRFSPQELQNVELADPLPFTKGVRTMRIPASHHRGGAWRLGTLLFDTHQDPEQRRPIADPDVELRMLGLLHRGLIASDAPLEQFERLGLPAQRADLNRSAKRFLRAQEGKQRAERRWSDSSHEMRLADTLAALGPTAHETDILLRTPLRDLLANPVTIEAFRRHVPEITQTELLTISSDTSLLDFAVANPDILPVRLLRRTVAELPSDGLTRTETHTAQHANH